MPGVTSADKDASRDERKARLRRENEELVEGISRLKKRIHRLEEQRSELRERLKRREKRLQLLKTGKSANEAE